MSGTLLIRQAIDQLNPASKTVELLRTEMNRLAQQLPEYPVVMAMGGAGKSLGLQLMTESGDVRHELWAEDGIDAKHPHNDLDTLGAVRPM